MRRRVLDHDSNNKGNPHKIANSEMARFHIQQKRNHEQVGARELKLKIKILL